jgi:hypothetical protein
MVDHKFLILIHSFMEHDHDFGITQKLKMKNKYIFVPNDWVKNSAKTSKNSLSLWWAKFCSDSTNGRYNEFCAGFMRHAVVSL